MYTERQMSFGNVDERSVEEDRDSELSQNNVLEPANRRMISIVTPESNGINELDRVINQHYQETDAY